MPTFFVFFQEHTSLESGFCLRTRAGAFFATEANERHSQMSRNQSPSNNPQSYKCGLARLVFFSVTKKTSKSRDISFGAKFGRIEALRFATDTQAIRDERITEKIYALV